MENSLIAQNKEHVKKFKKNLEIFIRALSSEFEKETGACVEVIRIEANTVQLNSGEFQSLGLDFSYKITL